MQFSIGNFIDVYRTFPVTPALGSKHSSSAYSEVFPSDNVTAQRLVITESYSKWSKQEA